MKHLSETLKLMKTNGTLPMQQSVQCKDSLPKISPSVKNSIQEIQSQHTTLEEFLLQKNPSRQLPLNRSPDSCYFGNSPTLSMLKLAYGSTAAEIWLVPQLTSVSNYCGLKEKVTEEQLFELATIIATNYHWLKTDELMLFFARFKATEYERFFSYFDPQVILASLKQFLCERNRAFEKREQEIRMRRMEEDRKKAITYEQYLKLKEDVKMVDCYSAVVPNESKNNKGTYGKQK